MEPITAAHQGKQLTKLRLALSKALDASMYSCSKQKLAAAFPSLTRDEPKCLDMTRDQIVDFLTLNCKEEFESILETRCIPEKLLAMDSLKKRTDAEDIQESIKQTSSHQVATPIQSVEAHILASKRAELERLNATLECLENDNKTLLESVLEKRAGVHSAKEWVHQLTLDKLAADSIGQLETCL